MQLVFTFPALPDSGIKLLFSVGSTSFASGWPVPKSTLAGAKPGAWGFTQQVDNKFVSGGQRTKQW